MKPETKVVKHSLIELQSALEPPDACPKSSTGGRPIYTKSLSKKHMGKQKHGRRAKRLRGKRQELGTADRLRILLTQTEGV